MKKILIVDDAAYIRMMLKDVLTKSGYTELFEAANGSQAVEKYNEIKPALVFMNIAMPEMNGVDALKRIINRDSDAKVVMLSKAGEQALVIESIKAGAKDFITKPLKADQIIKVVSKLL